MKTKPQSHPAPAIAILNKTTNSHKPHKTEKHGLKSWLSQKNVPEIILQQLHWGEKLLDGT